MKISVALCTYNGELFLSQQLDSIFAQELSVSEIVICDDGSTDNTKEILEYYKETFPHIIKIYFNNPGLGVIKNFEKAINLCSGDIVFLSDQDDIWFPNKTIEICNYLQENPDKKAVFHNLELYDGHALKFTIWDYLSFGGECLRLNNQEMIKYCFFVDNVVTGAALAFRKEKDFSFSNQISFMLHDFQLFTYFALKNQFGTYNKVLGYYRIHNQQQVGAKSEVNLYLATKNAVFFSTDSHQQLIGFEEVKNRNVFVEPHSRLLVSVDHILNDEIIKLRNRVLAETNFIKRKKILLKWYLKKRLQISLMDLIVK